MPFQSPDTFFREFCLIFVFSSIRFSIVIHMPRVSIGDVVRSYNCSTFDESFQKPLEFLIPICRQDYVN